jgi:hypothetical protein
VPILKAGMLKGKVVPSEETDERNAVRASSLSPDFEIDVGSDTSRYIAGLDMAAAVVVEEEVVWHGGGARAGGD